MSTTNVIFTPIKVGNNKLTHSVVLAPLTRYRATIEAVPTDLQAEYYKQRASEGGLLITEATFIDRLAGGYTQAPGIYNEEQIEVWMEESDLCCTRKEGFYLYANLACTKYEVPRALEVHEIKELIQHYRQASLNAIEAGFDGVEVHSANVFLLDQFTASSSNKRTDIFGGSIESRARFTLEVIDAVVGAIGAERTALRIAPGASLQDAQGDTPVETYGYIISEVQKKHPRLGYIHLMEVRSNVLDSEHVNTVDSLEPYRRLWKGPIITAGGFSTALEHGLDLAEKTGDLIAFGREFIANPDLPERLRNGWELNKYDGTTFYTHESEGYIDYPFYNATKK